MGGQINGHGRAAGVAECPQLRFELGLGLQDVVRKLLVKWFVVFPRVERRQREDDADVTSRVLQAPPI